MLKELIAYYERELSYLRQLGQEFANRYPNVASRLQLQADACPDPHVERLIESFAFLTARIQRKLDDEFPEITEALLGVLYPHFLRPVPSMSVVELNLDPKDCQLTEGQEIPRHTRLFTRPVKKGMRCQFRTAYPITLWPVRVDDARVEAIERSPFAVSGSQAVAVLRVRLECLGDITFDKLGMDRLRFYLHGDGPTIYTLYELLFNKLQKVELTFENEAGAKTTTVLPEGSLQPVGFDDDQSLLDHDARSFVGYRLLHEYFTFPQKFLFIDLVNLKSASGNAWRHLEAVFYIEEFEREERLPLLKKNVSASTFVLGCTPVVNLFKQQAEPVRVTHRKSEYQVFPDIRRPWGMEVYSVDSVKEFSRGQDFEGSLEFAPIYSYRHAGEEDRNQTYWLATRRPSARKADYGTEVFLTLIDTQFDPSVPAVDTLSVGTTCTNRDIPALLPVGGRVSDFEMDGESVASAIRCLFKPTPVLRPPMRHGIQWRLISHLALNHLSLVEGGREALQEILSLYNFKEELAPRKQITGILRVDSRTCVARIGKPPYTSFCRGTDVEVVLDEDQFVGSGIYLFGAVLERFIGLYSSVNSFTRLSIRTKQREGIVKVWPPRAGEAILG